MEIETQPGERRARGVAKKSIKTSNKAIKGKENEEEKGKHGARVFKQM